MYFIKNKKQLKFALQCKNSKLSPESADCFFLLFSNVQLLSLFLELVWVKVYPSAIKEPAYHKAETLKVSKILILCYRKSAPCFRATY